jgi:hypothetical protein
LQRVLLSRIARYKLNIWDVGGQKTIRSYWRNYFEKTDALIWVVDATDRLRIGDCRNELSALLLEEVQSFQHESSLSDVRDLETGRSKLAGISKQNRRGRRHAKLRSSKGPWRGWCRRCCHGTNKAV